MKRCCDENIKRSITTLLEQEGYDIVRVQDEHEPGFEDEAIVRFCRETDRVLLTNDDDFFEFDEHPGVLFLDEQRASPRSVSQRFSASIATSRIRQDRSGTSRMGGSDVCLMGECSDTQGRRGEVSREEIVAKIDDDE
jgi:predicted nuclease of predicted toxin-antitoxin system